MNCWTFSKAYSYEDFFLVFPPINLFVIFYIPILVRTKWKGACLLQDKISSLKRTTAKQLRDTPPFVVLMTGKKSISSSIHTNDELRPSAMYPYGGTLTLHEMQQVFTSTVGASCCFYSHFSCHDSLLKNDSFSMILCVYIRLFSFFFFLYSFSFSFLFFCLSNCMWNLHCVLPTCSFNGFVGGFFGGGGVL